MRFNNLIILALLIACETREYHHVCRDNVQIVIAGDYPASCNLDQDLEVVPVTAGGQQMIHCRCRK